MSVNTLAAQFESFGRSHCVAIAVTIVAAAILAAWGRLAKSRRVLPAIRWAVVVILIGNELIYLGHGLVTRPWGEFVRNCLPLHVCGAAVFLVAWTLIRPHQYIYELTYFWGLGGTLQAVITPDITKAFPSYSFIVFFITHGAIVVGVAVATWSMKMRPTKDGPRRVILTTLALMVVVGCIDWLIGANYMFLCEGPVGASPLFFLPWPWYLPFLIAVGTAIVLLLYLPFFLSDRADKK